MNSKWHILRTHVTLNVNIRSWGPLNYIRRIILKSIAIIYTSLKDPSSICSWNSASMMSPKNSSTYKDVNLCTSQNQRVAIPHMAQGLCSHRTRFQGIPPSIQLSPCFADHQHSVREPLQQEFSG